MINILLNGESKTVTASTTVDQLINQLGLQNKRLAVEINQQIVPRSRFTHHQLQNNDRVEIVQAIGGG